MRFSKCKSTPFRYPSASSCPETPLLANLERTPIKRMADCCGARLYRIKSAPRNSRSSNLVSKSTFLARNYASLPPIFESQLRNPPTYSPLPTKQCFIRDKSNINVTGATVTTENVFRSGASLTWMKIKIIFCNFLRNAVTKIPC